MLRYFPGIILACLAGLVPTLSVAQEKAVAANPDIIISSGLEGGGYWNAAARLQVVAAELGLAVGNLASSGSLDNLEKLLDRNSPVSMAFAQADALRHYFNEHPGDEKQIDILETIGRECVFIVTGVNSNISNISDLQEAGKLRLGIASATSGIAVTFDYMSSQLPELGDIEVIYGDTRSAMEQLDRLGASVDAVMMVHRPRELSLEVEKALAHPQRFRFVELDGEGLDMELANGRRVYRPMNLSMPDVDEPVKTICVEGLLLVNKKKVQARKRNELTDLVNYHWMRVYATP